MTTVESWGRFTRTDFEALPEDADDGLRYELLDDAVPAGLQVFVAPLDVYLPTDDILEPDVLVVRDDAIVDDKIHGVPLLAVEVISPSSRRRDVGDKLTAYRDAGVPSYWVVDPIEPRLRVWQLVTGQYVEVADILGDQVWTAAVPYAVTVRPNDLLR